jgi:hypothetical protein
MSDKGYKAAERRHARSIGTERIPSTGQKDAADYETPMFCFQEKRGYRLPSYLRGWLDGVVVAASARVPAKVGVVVWQQKYGRDEEALVILRWKDFVELHGAPRG